MAIFNFSKFLNQSAELAKKKFKNFKTSFLFIFAVILTLGLSISFQSLLADWTAPVANPPTCASGNPGCSAPLNAGPLLQTKSGPLWINTDGISPLGLIVENGNVGIGTAGPSNLLHIEKAIATGANDGILVKSTGVGQAQLRLRRSGGTASDWYMYAPEASADLRFYSPGAGELVSFTNTGKVGIGTLAPSQKLDVNGNVQATAFLYSSDKNLKDNIEILSNSLDKISQLNGVSFSWRDNGQKSIGLIAQDVEKIFPELVTTSPDSGLKSLNYAGLIAPLIEAVKEQQAEIKSLKEQLRLLEK
ncbi:MAG: tail fiber domain-containing protein [Patescibacteria group bacterium]|jgi:hypothetical protein